MDSPSQIAFRSVWRYEGPSPGKHLNHLVISADPAEDVVVTTTPDLNFSWLGPFSDFLKNFTFVKPSA